MSSSATIIIVVVFVVAFIALKSLPNFAARRITPTSSQEVPQQRNLDALPLPVSTISAKPLLSPWEKAVIDSVRMQLPPRHHLCPQVRLLDMLSVQDQDRSRQQTTRNRLGSKSVNLRSSTRTGAWCWSSSCMTAAMIVPIAATVTSWFRSRSIRRVSRWPPSGHASRSISVAGCRPPELDAERRRIRCLG